MPSKSPDDLLEPDALKDARPVLRGEGSRDALPPTRLASTAYVTFTVPTTVQIPRTITPQTDPQTAEYAVRAFYGVTYSWHNHQDGDGVLATRDTIQAVVTALMESGAVTVLYEDAKHEQTARTLYPSAVMLTEEHYVACKAYCTFRQRTQTFRLDRMRCVHPVTFPGEVAAA